MKIFILEDNITKLEHITKVLNDNFENVEIDTCPYFNEGLSNIFNTDYDFIILDNAVPRFRDSNDIVFNAAEHCLAGMELRGINTKCIICSGDNVDLENSYKNLICILKYSSMSLDWANKLVKYIRNNYD